MADFTYICKNLGGSAPAKGNESVVPTCARNLETGSFCTADSADGAVAGKARCPSADYLKILPIRKKSGDFLGCFRLLMENCFQVNRVEFAY